MQDFLNQHVHALDVYGDYISEDDGAVANTLPEPLTAAKPFEAAANAVSLFG